MYAISLFNISGLLAFSAGFLSFFSPCILPLVPSYLIFISGITFDNYNELKAKKYRKVVLIHSVAFILGFSFVFVSLGISSSILGNFLTDYQEYIIKVGGIFLIAMGLFYLNILRIPFLNQEKLIRLEKKPIGLFGSFVIGATFSLGWTPCVGPALSSILIVASTTKKISEGIYLLGLYSLGLAIPFILSALLFDKLFDFLKRYGFVMRYSTKIMGVLLLVMGVLLATSYYTTLTLKLGQFFSF
ncbi:MAG: cytochrome c biogenesis protein CcdA [Syntrophorhabdaceae bacterium]|nr:cytochrome c biogenesis protein CcdA [Syntrophorhabdaceae bacterium]MDD5244964.1 cytochrome c biogenesis protein CcdA [Syntrophorhabdaceae bacterium]